jgi:hypothetical protein
VDGRQFLRRLKRQDERLKRRILRWAETPEQRQRRQQREALKEEERLRRKLAKIGHTPEEFEEGAKALERKLFGKQ